MFLSVYVILNFGPVVNIGQLALYDGYYLYVNNRQPYDGVLFIGETCS
jgi:hypothetical protein